MPDLATWVQCFTLYMVKQEPERASSLLAYMEEVARASMKYRWPSWVVYDKKLTAGSGGVRTQGLVQHRAKHLLPVFYRNAYQSGGLVQALRVN